MRGKKSRNNTWLDTQKRPILVRSRLVAKPVRSADNGKDVCTGTSPLKVMNIVLSRKSRGHRSCFGLSIVSVVFFHRENEAVLHGRWVAWKRDKEIVNNNSWSIDAWRMEESGDADNQSFIVRRSRIPRTGEVTRLLTQTQCREDKEQAKTLVAYYDSMTCGTTAGCE